MKHIMKRYKNIISMTKSKMTRSVSLFIFYCTLQTVLYNYYTDVCCQPCAKGSVYTVNMNSIAHIKS